MGYIIFRDCNNLLANIKNMKIIYLTPLLLMLLSCSPVKINMLGGTEGNSSKELIGDIKHIKQHAYHYPIKENGAKMPDYNIELFYNKKNILVRQIDSYPKYPKYHEETTYKYKKNLLESSISINKKRISKVEYKYDNKKNLIKYNDFENGKLGLSITSIYDKKNNIVEKKGGIKNKITTEKYSYDYKNKLITILIFDENNKKKKSSVKYRYNEKGFIVKTEVINTGKGYSTANKKEYDKYGDLKRKIKIKKDGTDGSMTEYKNTCDNKGNIIVREMFLNKRLIQKIVNTITYR